MRRLIHIGKRPGPRETWSEKPDWVQANPARIERALARAKDRPTGGWFVLDASRRFGKAPRKMVVAGQELVVWRGGEGEALAAPAACPHMGADLSCGHVREGRIVCPWHGLALGTEGHGRWQTLPTHDDGVLLWVRLPEAGEKATERPILAPRPERFLDGVIRVEAVCEPEDVVANRLDPWHGVHFHPHSFARLRVLDADDDVITLRVSFRILGPLAMEVDCTFHSPEPRSIVMTIVDGDGQGSVVETHATPLEEGRTAIVEATLATSDRKGFPAAEAVRRLLRPLIEVRAGKLWVEDADYAERRYALRTQSPSPAPKRQRAKGRGLSVVRS